MLANNFLFCKLNIISLFQIDQIFPLVLAKKFAHQTHVRQEGLSLSTQLFVLPSLHPLELGLQQNQLISLIKHGATTQTKLAWVILLTKLCLEIIQIKLEITIKMD